MFAHVFLRLSAPVLFQFCRTPDGGKGRCCQPADTVPQPPVCGQSLNIRILGVSPDATEANFGKISAESGPVGFIRGFPG